MNSLETLWLGSLTLAAFSLAIMVTLLIARAVSSQLAQGRAKERERLVSLLLGDTASPEAEAPLLRVGGKQLAFLSVELIQLVRGTDRERFVANATAMGVPERLRHQLGSGPPRARLAAAEALAQFDDEKSLQRLEQALDDPHPEVRIAAALSLAAVGKPPPARELVFKLGIGSTENSLLAVSLLRDVAVSRPNELKELLVNEDIPAGAKAAVIESLSASADYTLVPMIVSLAGEEGDPGYLTRYIAALGAFGHPAGEPAVKRGLQSPHWDVRAAAAQAAGRIGLVTVASNLKQLLSDPEWWVRFRAGEALTRLGPVGADYLRAVVSSGHEPARTAASKILAERGLQ